MPTFTNMATLTYNGSTVNSNIVTGEIREVLTAVKTAVGNSYAVGETVTYVVSIVNTGTTAFTGLTLTDDLGAYSVEQTTVYPLTYVDGSVRYYVNGVLQTAPTVTAGPPMVLSNISVPAGGNALVIYEVRVNAYAPPAQDSTVVNTVTVSGTGLTAALTAQETVTVRTGADLVITKALNPLIVPENGQLTYTFTIQNFGNAAVLATDDAVLADTFDPVLKDIAVTFNGETWTLGTNYAYDLTTGQFTTLAGQIAVPTATFAQNTDGTWSVTPGVSTLTVTGTV